ncbi:MAG TPA: glycosyltransferase family 1 protein [Abditibacteriaceae bacterium]|jgi:glycosyltransferase involved in cell wall biosynthesis
MHIALDVRVVRAAKTGDRTYALTLLQGLAALNLDAKQWKFSLLLDGPDDENILPQSPCFETVVLPAQNSRLWTLVALPRWARRARPDLVHVQYLAPLTLCCPFVSTIHDVVWRAQPATFPPLHRTILTRFMPGTARRAAKIICGSEAAKQDIARYLRVRKMKIKVMPYAVESRFHQAAKDGITAVAISAVRARYGLGEQPYILSVGVRQPRKNLARLQTSFARLKNAHPDWPHQLVIVGKEGWGEETAAPSDTIFTGYVADDDLPALYAGAEVFAYPSLYEGFGLPVVEAQCCSTPVLTSNISSLPEAAGGAALLVNPYSEEELARGLERILTDAPLRNDLRARAEKHVKNHTPESLALATLAIYQSV